MEVYMFAETEEPGRFLRIEETTLMLKVILPSNSGHATK